ncbi:MAG: hypothetical protein JKP92_08415 [Alphaproteobacteria bacterium]|jgi:hypothetical protein|nr:hypothetical protein [Alphaproteobacteria bacterium]
MNRLDQFHEALSRHAPRARAQAIEAHRNLTGFVSLLLKVNEREKIAPLTPAESEACHA